MLQGIARWIARAAHSFEGGLATAGLGLGASFSDRVCGRIGFLRWPAGRFEFLTHSSPLCRDVLYGIGVYIVMYWFVLPMAFPTFRQSGWGTNCSQLPFIFR